MLILSLKKMYHLIKTLFAMLLSIYCAGLYADNTVDIFDENRGQAKKDEPVKKEVSRPNRKTSKGAEFSLSGISKIEDKYVIYLDTIKGKRDKFSWRENQPSAVIKIYNDYEINKIINRTLYLNILGSKPCVADEKKGISCDQENKQMVMQLVRKKPIIKAPPAKKSSALRSSSARARSKAISSRAKRATATQEAQTQRPKNFPFKRSKTSK